MVRDADLKFNKNYWAIISDKQHPNCGDEIQVQFSGIAFQNLKYLTPGDVHKFSDDEKEQARQKFFNKRISHNPDAVFMLDQIKIFREVKQDELK